MKLFREDDVLDIEFRKKVIMEITGTENVERKQEFLRRYEIYKDRVRKWVIQRLMDEGFKRETVAQMQNRAGNVSLCRKVVNKLARTYNSGVTRETGNDTTDEQVQTITEMLCWDDKMRKSDRYRELHKNSAIQIVVEPDMGEADTPDDEPPMKLKMRALNPWQYDVIEDPYDREVPRCWIISDFVERDIGAFQGQMAKTEAEAGVHHSKPYVRSGRNHKDDTIADDPDDAGMGSEKEYVWWTKSYHFTTNSKGEVIQEKSPEELANPIGIMPIVNNAEEQDGQFWAEGGDDLIEGAILVNTVITDMLFIARNQGFGQFVVTGKNILNQKIEIGPNNAIMIEQGEEDPTPNVNVLSTNPPIQDWMGIVEQYVALLLTTNNLSPANVRVNLDAQSFPSGIAMLIEQSEAREDVGDKEKQYQDIERQLWEIASKWLEVGSGAGELTPEWQAVGSLPMDLDVAVKFAKPQAVVTETEKLDAMKARADLGISSKVDLIMIDNPELTREQAEEKLMKIMEEKVAAMAQFAPEMAGAQEADEDPESDREGDAEDSGDDEDMNE